MQSVALDEFKRLADDFNVIPMVRERLADFETPISLTEKLRGQDKLFLLESVEGGESWGRFSILGFDIRKEFVIDGDGAVLRIDGAETTLDGNPVDALQAYLRDFRTAECRGLPRFFGGAVGYFSFESVRFFERCGEVKENRTLFPDAHFMIADHLAVFDNVSHTVQLVCCVHTRDFPSPEAAYQHGQETLDRIEAVFDCEPPPQTGASSGSSKRNDQTDMSSNMSREAFEDMVRSAKGYICDGDIIQVVLAQHFTADNLDVDYFDIYRALRYINPSPYLYFLKLDAHRAIAGSSPEVMVRVTGRHAEVRPIAGTRPRGTTPAEDSHLADELLADPKERAEHVMLVDLARNDLGRIADISTVHVRDYMCIERYSHVMHIVSHVDGTVRPEFDAIDVFKATFPAGTLSGAPKVRAMEIINELEPIRRGPYGGALGYIAYGGQVMDMAITIRTVVLENDKATVTAGAGLVFDSVPETEYHETLHKSQGMRQALDLAVNGLRIDIHSRNSAERI